MISEDRIRSLEDRLAIRELISAYCFAMDNKDLGWAERLFTPDACFRSVDGVMNATGWKAIGQQYEGRFAALRFAYHVTHDVLIEFMDEDHAKGMVSGHAEVVRNGEAMVTGLRYADQYTRDHDGRWRFAERVLSFFYYVPVEQYRTALEGGGRMRAYGDVREADLPDLF